MKKAMMMQALMMCTVSMCMCFVMLFSEQGLRLSTVI